MTATSTPRILVVGAGVAAIEFVLAVRERMGERAEITVVTPKHEFTVRPLQLTGTATPDLAELAEDVGFTLVLGSVAAVEPARRRALLRSGGAIPYDTLVLAPGVAAVPAYDEALHLGIGDSAQTMAALHDEISSGEVSRVAFVVPSTTGWLVPAYDAALLTAARDATVEITLVTPERHPLERFGAEASALVGAALRDAAIRFVRGQVEVVEPGRLQLLDGRSVFAGRVVSLPLVRGPVIAGVPATGLFGLIDVDAFGRVKGLAHAYAIGDATTHPVKQAALACAQADTAAWHLAGHHGHAQPAQPVHEELRATLHDSGGQLLHLNGGQGIGKVPGRLLAAYLQERTAGGVPRP
jgi:sulfide:quinone oxidoreductase